LDGCVDRADFEMDGCYLRRYTEYIVLTQFLRTTGLAPRPSLHRSISRKSCKFVLKKTETKEGGWMYNDRVQKAKKEIPDKIVKTGAGRKGRCR